MNKSDLRLLRAALASNGGGINSDLYSEAARKRLMKAGLIQWKPNSRTVYVSLLTITPAGKEAVVAAAPSLQQGKEGAVS